MTEYQQAAMDRAGEHGEPIFRAPSVGGSGEKQLRKALRELLDAWMCEMPNYEHGQAAQDAWADRRTQACNTAAALLANALAGETS
jgi:hypothetical protein